MELEIGYIIYWVGFAIAFGMVWSANSWQEEKHGFFMCILLCLWVGIFSWVAVGMCLGDLAGAMRRIIKELRGKEH